MAIQQSKIFLKTFPEAKSVVVSGDIHGGFNELVFKMCEQYKMKDTLLIVAGDCGFGFERPGYYENMVRKNTKRMSAANNWIVFVRGNHDNPDYFDGCTFNHKHFLAIPDYTLIQACSHNILCVGGAISVDRQYRLDRKPIDKEIYWEKEAPVFNAVKIEDISQSFKVDTVVTHSAPSFCEVSNKLGMSNWTMYDETLEDDVAHERQVMDEVYALLRHSRHPLHHWYYGHFHQSWRSSIDGVMFKMLDIMEFCEVN